MKISKLLVIASATLVPYASLHAGEPIDIQGDFALSTNPPFPDGWNVNKPGYWEDTNTAERRPLEGTDCYSLLLTSGEKPIHFYSGNRVDVSEGQIYIVKAKVKGTGSGAVGAYFYGSVNPSFKRFTAFSNWEEIVAELTIPAASTLPTDVPPVEKIAALLVVDPGSSIEFSEVSMELVE